MSQPAVSIEFSHSLEELTREFDVTLGQVDKALARSVRKLRKWIQTQLARQLAAAVRVRQKALKPRFRHHVSRDGQTINASIWIGVNPLAAHQVGTPQQLPQGSKAYQHFFDRAFVANVFGDQEKIWRRKGKKRFPVIQMVVPIAEEMAELLPRMEQPAALQMAKLFEHELKFEAGWFS